MRLSELFEVLASGELANLYMADGGLGELKPTHQKVLLNSINLGLVDLHTRFLLKKEVKSIFVLSNEIEFDDPRFIELTAISHNKKTLITNIDYYHKSPKKIVLNQASEYIVSGLPIVVEYKAKPYLLTVEDIAKDTVIDLPDSYLNALCLFIASRLYTSLNNQLDGDLTESTRYLQRYHDELNMLTNQGIDTDSLDDMWLFHKKGFI